MVPPLAVTVDASVLSGQSRRSGLGRFTTTLLEGLARRADVAVTAMAPTNVALPAGVHRHRTWRLGRGRFEALDTAARSGFDARRAGNGTGTGAVLHVPAGLPPLWPVHPWVHTLHDVIPLVLTEGEHSSSGAQWHRHGPRMRRADLVVAVSRFSADAGIAALGLDPRRVEVVHPGLDRSFAPAPAGRATSSEGPPELLVVGEVSHRKGLARAVAVLDLLAEAGSPATLTVVGHVPAASRAALEGVLGGSRYHERVHLAGFVDDVVACYRRAACFLGVSRYEGFGLPAAEAMACATPVVAFANTATTEVVGDGGLLVSDGDVVAMAAAVRRVLDEPSLADELRGRGLARAGAFDADAAAAAYAEAYRSVAAAAVS